MKYKKGDKVEIKDGDFIICNNRGQYSIAIYKTGSKVHCGLLYFDLYTEEQDIPDNVKIELASEEDKKYLLEIIEHLKYKWDGKQLIKL